MYAAHLYILRAILRDEPALRGMPGPAEPAEQSVTPAPEPLAPWRRWAGALRRRLGLTPPPARPGGTPAMSGAPTGG